MGTALRASKSCVSVIAAKALIPARNSSLFLTGCFKSAARSFRLSSMRYSGLGIVKLSRTNLTFLALMGFAISAFTAGTTVTSMPAFIPAVFVAIFLDASTTLRAVVGDLLGGLETGVVIVVVALVGFVTGFFATVEGALASGLTGVLDVVCVEFGIAYP